MQKAFVELCELTLSAVSGTEIGNVLCVLCGFYYSVQS